MDQPELTSNPCLDVDVGCSISYNLPSKINFDKLNKDIEVIRSTSQYMDGSTLLFECLVNKIMEQAKEIEDLRNKVNSLTYANRPLR